MAGHVIRFIEDEALSGGAAIAFYTVTSLAPVLLIVVAIAGLVFGLEAAQDAILNQLTALMGKEAVRQPRTSRPSRPSQYRAVCVGRLMPPRRNRCVLDEW